MADVVYILALGEGVSVTISSDPEEIFRSLRLHGEYPNAKVLKVDFNTKAVEMLNSDPEPRSNPAPRW